MHDSESLGLRHCICGTADPRLESATDNSLDDPSINAEIRMEWAKADARALRFEEDTLLVLEEMRRTLAFFQWKAEWWLSQRGRLMTDPQMTADIQSGLDAYAARQASMYHALSRKFARRWKPVLKSVDLLKHCTWISKYVAENDNGILPRKWTRKNGHAAPASPPRIPFALEPSSLPSQLALASDASYDVYGARLEIQDVLPQDGDGGSDSESEGSEVDAGADENSEWEDDIPDFMD